MPDIKNSVMNIKSKRANFQCNIILAYLIVSVYRIDLSIRTRNSAIIFIIQGDLLFNKANP